jgi:hypothetical protein
MHACSRRATYVCAHPGDIDRDGNGGGFPFEVAPGQTESLEGVVPSRPPKAGVSRGTTGLRLHAAASRHQGPIAPYAGFELLLEADGDDSDFGGDRFWNEGPPLQGSFSLGTEIMPWEVVEQFQRFSVDLRVSGTYVGAGQDYSPLFDALGSSAAPSFRRPRFSAYRQNPDPASAEDFPSVVDPRSERVFATGITRVAAHGKGQLSLTARWQAGRYVRFDVGGSLALTQPHFVTGTPACDESRRPGPAESGPCGPRDEPGASGAGTPDPSHRPEIDLPGRRFLVEGESAVDAWMSATLMF